MNNTLFAKLSGSIITSSIWEENDHTRIVWITLLALADREGYVLGDPAALSAFARVPVESVVAALKTLMAPDAKSRNKKHGGRRIEALIDGWHILNYAEYRRKLTPMARKDYNRKYQQGYRMDEKLNAAPSASEQSPVAPSPPQRRFKAEAAHGDEQFERCWAKFRRIGAKKIAVEYWKKISQQDRDAIEACIPDYLKCVDGGRLQKQFEGWINPANRMWDQDWKATLEMYSRRVGQPRRVGAATFASDDPFVVAAREREARKKEGKS